MVRVRALGGPFRSNRSAASLRSIDRRPSRSSSAALGRRAASGTFGRRRPCRRARNFPWPPQSASTLKRLGSNGGSTQRSVWMLRNATPDRIDPDSASDRSSIGPSRPQIDPKSTPDRPRIDRGFTPEFDHKWTPHRTQVDPDSTADRLPEQADAAAARELRRPARAFVTPAAQPTGATRRQPRAASVWTRPGPRPRPAPARALAAPGRRGPPCRADQCGAGPRGRNSAAARRVRDGAHRARLRQHLARART